MAIDRVGVTCVGILPKITPPLETGELGVPGSHVLVERSGTLEHHRRILHGRHVPWADVLVEADAILEHPLHVGHFRDIPGLDILVETAGTHEHPVHVRHR